MQANSMDRVQNSYGRDLLSHTAARNRSRPICLANRIISTLSLAVSLILVTSAGHAVPMTNPDPSLYGNDTEGAFVFPSSITDMRVNKGVDLSNAGSSFGFYFPGPASPTLIEIFGADDSGPPPDQLATIDFVAGTVTDLDVTTIQANFAPTSNPGAIGFWYMASSTGTPLFTDPGQNVTSGGEDFAGIFPSLSDPFALVVTFEDPLDPNVAIFSANVITGAVPARSVPAPVTVVLVVIGAFAYAGISAWRRRFA